MLPFSAIEKVVPSAKVMPTEPSPLVANWSPWKTGAPGSSTDCEPSGWVTVTSPPMVVT